MMMFRYDRFSAEQVSTPHSPLAQPGQPVRVGQRGPAAHLLDILARVQVVAFLEMAAQRAGEQRRDGAFAGSGDTHHHDDHRLGDGVREGCGPHALRLLIGSCHAIIPDHTRA
jgi:hypothetical protein